MPDRPLTAQPRRRLLPALLAGALALVLAAALAACGSSDDADAGTAAAGGGATTGAPSSERASVTLALDWFAQPSSGGPYAAQDAGLYDRAGLDVTIQPGTAHATSVQIVGAGRAQFGLETAENIVQARAQGIPVVALAATLQRSPAALFFHEGQPISSYRDLDGRVVYTQIGAPQWIYQKRKYGLDDVKDRQFAGSYAAFAQDEKAVAQGYLTSTPAQLEAQGLKVRALPNPEAIGYGSVLFTTEQEIAEHPDVVRRFVAATAAGWERYRTDVPGVSRVLARQAKGRTVADLEAEGRAQEAFIWTGDAAQAWGVMTRARWQAVADELLKEGAIRSPIDVDAAFTTEFLPAS
jgi:NitT/TauT family transport system substrate-binding protein